MPRERRCLQHSGAQQSHLPAEFLSNRRPRRRGMAASSPLHRGASASRQPSSHSLHGITASNAALPSRRLEGLVGPLRPWSGSRSRGGPPRPRYTLFSHGSCADVRAKTVARGKTARVRLCPWILQAPTMPAAIGTKNKIGTRFERREKGSDRLPPWRYHARVYTSTTTSQHDQSTQSYSMHTPNTVRHTLTRTDVRDCLSVPHSTAGTPRGGCVGSG